MRITALDPSDAPPEVAEALTALPDLGLFGVVAHAQDAFAPWLAYGGALMTQLALEPRLRELAILEVARAEESSYERTQHEGIARRLRMPEAQLAAVARGDLDDPAFDVRERLALLLAREIAETGAGREETVAAVVKRLGTRELVARARGRPLPRHRAARRDLRDPHRRRGRPHGCARRRGGGSMTSASPTAAPGDLAAGACLAHRRVLVVGGGQQDYGQPDPPVGIGRAIARLCAREGATVAVLDRDRDAAERSAAEIRAAGSRAIALHADASDDDALGAAVDRAHDELGGLDGLVLAVGIAGGLGLAGTDADVWDLVMATNVRGHFLACRHALPLLDSGASVVFVSSTAPRKPSTNDMPAYLASKAALEGLCAHTAREAAGRGVRANVVAAGLIDTSLGRLATAVKPGRADIPIALGRQGTAWEVAQAAVFLLSDRASYVTGQTLVVDGGLTGAG